MKDTEESFWGLALAPFSSVDQEKLAHLILDRNTQKASQSRRLMPLNLALKTKLLSRAVIVDIVGIIYVKRACEC